MNGETNWLTPDLLKRAKAVAKKEGGGRRVLMRVFHLTDHKARILADIIAGRAEVPAQKLSIIPAETLVKIPERKSGKYRFGLVSDTHFGSTEMQLSMLERTYDLFEDAGVSQVYHAGDLIAGINVYRGQLQDLHLFTIDQQVEYAAERYPRRQGIKTSVIGGNHDLACTLSGGADPMRVLAANREDIRYLGPLSANIVFGPLRMYLVHPKGGLSYAVSYRAQKFVESLEGGKKPDIICLGHWHQQAYFVTRHVHVVLPGCYEGQTGFERALALMPQLGGVMLDIEITDTTEAGPEYLVTPTFHHYYVPREKNW